MAGVILILGLIAAGIYTENAAFYWVAGTLGVLALILQIVVIGLIKSVKGQIDKGTLHSDKLTRRMARGW